MFYTKYSKSTFSKGVIEKCRLMGHKSEQIINKTRKRNLEIEGKYNIINWMIGVSFVLF